MTFVSEKQTLENNKLKAYAFLLEHCGNIAPRAWRIKLSQTNYATIQQDLIELWKAIKARNML
jgi:hypothetical protein